MKCCILLLLLFGLATNGIAQTNMYLVRFTDKVSSPYSINSPTAYLSQKAIERRFKQGIPILERDLPPNPSYLTGIKSLGANVIYTTRWLNGAVIACSPIEIANIIALPYVSHIEFGKELKTISGISSFRKEQTGKLTTVIDYGDADTQIQLLGVNEMHEMGYNGQGMLVAILDNGFLNANSIPCLDSTFSNNRVQEVYDFVDNDSTVFSQGGHGTNVMSCMASKLDGQLVAPAYGATYLLFRTEDDNSETRAEEAFWLIAAERADSLGTDIINTSLGYNTFDNPADNYSTAQMDGNTTLITRASDIAAATGMVIVNSAGNSGGTSWNIITAPADGDSVLAVGAVNRAGTVVSFSSRGYAADGDVKPDVMAVGSQTAIGTTSGLIGTSSGTSFSSPLTAAMIAGLWQANPLLSAYEIMSSVRESGHIYAIPNADYGYGYANFVRADSLAKSKYKISSLETNTEVLSISISPDNVSNFNFTFHTDLIGKSIRVSLINWNEKSLLFQTVATLANNSLAANLPINAFQNHFLIRIEDLTDAETIGIFKF